MRKTYKTGSWDKASDRIVVFLIWICMAPVILLLSGILTFLPCSYYFKNPLVGLFFYILLCSLAFYLLYIASKKHLIFEITIDDDKLIMGKQEVAYSSIKKVKYLQKKDRYNKYHFVEITTEEGKDRIRVEYKGIALRILKKLEEEHDFIVTKERKPSFLTQKIPFYNEYIEIFPSFLEEK